MPYSSSENEAEAAAAAAVTAVKSATKGVMKMIKKSIVWIAVMVILSTSLMIYTDIKRAPDTEGVVAELLLNPEYAEMSESEIFEPYTEFYSLGVKDIKILKATDGTSKEIAVIELKERYSDEIAIEILQKRQADLIKEFETNETELARIDESRIIGYDKFLVFTVCGSDDTAQEIVHEYFKRRKTGA